jgi:cellobiose-specific phosphotransferase system component IIC
MTVGTADVETKKAGRKKVGTTLGLVALVVAAVTVMLWFRQINQVDIPENRTAFVVFFLTSVALGIGAFVAGTRWFGGVAAVLAIIPGAFFPFTVAISPQEVAENRIRVGQTIPHFKAVDDQGQLFDSESLRGQTVLMKFFRGHW